jgi:hypothetical protein
MKIFGMLVISISLAAYAEESRRFTVLFKREVTCIEARRVLYESPLIVDCGADPKALARAYNATYSGALKSHQVIKSVKKANQVETVQAISE